MNKLQKYFLVLIGLISVFYLDFIRDYFFKNIGFQIYYLNHTSDKGLSSVNNYTDSFIEHYIKNFSIASLINLKWLLTAIFVIIFGTIGAFINVIFYQTNRIFIYFLFLYILLLSISFIIYSTALFTDDFIYQKKVYLISMEVAHFLQSSLPTLFFLVSFKIFQENKV